jgi:hypothetical protein
MGILNRDFEKAIKSSQADKIRSKIGVDKGNKLIQDLNNNYNKRSGSHCGYD